MSYHEYKESQEISAKNYCFYGLVMACMRQADDNNLMKLKSVFPEVLSELRERYNTPGGFLGDEASEVPVE